MAMWYLSVHFVVNLQTFLCPWMGVFFWQYWNASCDFQCVCRLPLSYFVLNKRTGFLIIKENTPTGSYQFLVRVSDRVWPDVVSSITVHVRELRDEAIYSSGSLRLAGKNATTRTSPWPLNPPCRYFAVYWASLRWSSHNHNTVTLKHHEMSGLPNKWD